MSENIILNPAVAFFVILAVVLIVTFLLKRLAFRAKAGEAGPDARAYSCGEDFQGHMIQPDYSQFFPFAFFFTILHVVALVIATVPAATGHTLAISVLYVVGAVIGLIILLRK